MWKGRRKEKREKEEKERCVKEEKNRMSNGVKE